MVSRGVLPSHSLHFRLNSRDYIRDRGSAEKPDSSFTMPSIRVALPDEPLGSQSKQTDISVIVRRSITSAHTQNKSDGSDPNMEHASDGPKLVRSLRFAFSRPDRFTLAEGYRHHFSMLKSNLGLEHVES